MLKWVDIGFASIMTIIVVLMFTMIYAGYQSTSRDMAEHKAFKIACIDAGGYPVTPFEYVKGHGEGYLCINPSAIIELN